MPEIYKSGHCKSGERKEASLKDREGRRSLHGILNINHVTNLGMPLPMATYNVK